MSKKFKLSGDQIVQLIEPLGYCLASDRITVDGCKVGYMYRESPDRPDDSGWRFFAGDETQEYADDPDHFAIYDVNTICNYDRDIISFLDAPCNSALGRDKKSGEFIVEHFTPPPNP